MQTPKRKADRYLRKPMDAVMTERKYKEIEKDLKHLIKTVRPRLAQEVKKHASDGDFSENTAYQIAKGKLRGLNRAIDEKSDLLKRAEIIEPTGNTDKVLTGNTVVVEINGKQKEYQILGAAETDPSSGIISKDSPLAQALMGKRTGDTARLERNGKKIEYKIIEIK